MLYCPWEVDIMTEQDLQAIRTIMKEDITELKESQEEVRDAVNALLDWSDKVSDSFRFPLPRI